MRMILFYIWFENDHWFGWAMSDERSLTSWRAPHHARACVHLVFFFRSSLCVVTMMFGVCESSNGAGIVPNGKNCSAMEIIKMCGIRQIVRSLWITTSATACARQQKTTRNWSRTQYNVGHFTFVSFSITRAHFANERPSLPARLLPVSRNIRARVARRS